MTNYGFIVVDLYDRFFGKDVYYLYAWTIYHILIPIWAFYYGFDHAMTFVTINPTNLHNTTNIMANIFEMKALFIVLAWSAVIVFLDLFFLLVVRAHFNLDRIKLKLPFSDRVKSYQCLSMRNITIIEVTIFILSFYSVSLRDVMLFLSINTIQMVVIYSFIKNVPFNLGRVFFTAAAYVFIFRLLIFPITH